MNKKRLLALLFASLTVLGISSVSITLAWYGSSYYNYVSPIEITLRSEPEIYISTSSEISSFKRTLEKDELKQVDEFHPVSSMYSSYWMSSKENYPKFAEDFSHVGVTGYPVFAQTGFYSQDLYLYSKDNVYVTFSKDNFSFTANETKNKQTAKTLLERFPSLSEDEIYENLNNITKSLRASVLLKTETSYDYYIYDPFKNSETILSGILDSDMNKYFDFDENTKKEIVYGEYQNEDKIVYREGTSEDVPYSGINTCFNAKHKANIEQFDLEASINNGYKPSYEQSISKDQIEDTMKITLKDEKPVHIVLSIYLEGWDKDNTNMVEFAAFYADIQFKIKGDIL